MQGWHLFGRYFDQQNASSWNALHVFIQTNESYVHVCTTFKMQYGDQYWYRDSIHIMVYWWLKNVKNVAPISI